MYSNRCDLVEKDFETNWISHGITNSMHMSPTSNLVISCKQLFFSLNSVYETMKQAFEDGRNP